MALSVVYPTRLQIRERVRFFIDEAQQANYSDTNLNWAINDAQQDVATEISLVDEKYFVDTTPTVITTVANQRFYTLASNFWKMIRFEDVSTGVRIDFRDFADSDVSSSLFMPPLVSPNQSGFTAAIVGNSLEFRPTPSTSGILSQYWFVPVLPSMNDDADVSPIPVQFIDLLAIQAAIDALISDEDDTAALERRYNRRFNQLVRGARDRQQQNPKKVSRVADGGMY